MCEDILKKRIQLNDNSWMPQVGFGTGSVSYIHKIELTLLKNLLQVLYEIVSVQIPRSM